MSTAEIESEIRQLKRRLSELEAANGLRAMAPRTDDEQVLAEVCSLVGIGIMSVQGVGKEADTVLKRGAVARVLRRKMGWTVPRIAKAMRKTPRSVNKMTVSSC